MKFIDDLKISFEDAREEQSLFDNRYPAGNRICEHLKINDEYSLSVQASEMHYSIPRALVPLKEYTHFEMALIYKGQLSYNADVIKGFAKYDELMGYYDGSVFYEVPKDLVEDLYIWWTKQ